MEKLDLYILALKNQIDNFKVKTGKQNKDESVVLEVLKACLELAVDIKKEDIKITPDGNI
jgi:hypothetical protein